MANVWLDDTSKFLQSDADEQLLLLIAFKGETKVRNFTITAPSDGSAPKSIKFFINKPDMNFDGKQMKKTKKNENNIFQV